MPDLHVDTRTARKAATPPPGADGSRVVEMHSTSNNHQGAGLGVARHNGGAERPSEPLESVTVGGGSAASLPPFVVSEGGTRRVNPEHWLNVPVSPPAARHTIGLAPSDWEEVKKRVPPDVREVEDPAEPPETRRPCWAVCMRITSQRWWHPSYKWDWLACLFCALVALAVFVGVAPFDRAIPGGVDNYALQYPRKDSTIGSIEVFLSYIFVAAVVVAACQFFVRSLHDLHSIVLACVTSLSLSVMVYAILVKIAGRLRPNFFDRLDVDYDPATYELTRERWDYHQSWPSGHAQNSMAVFFTVTLYLMGKLRAFAPHQGQTWKVLVAFVPTLLAFVIGASRTSDYMHDFSDVTAGLFFGMFFGAFAYFAQFPSLFDVRCHRPRVRRLMEYERYAAAKGTALMRDQSTASYGGRSPVMDKADMRLDLGAPGTAQRRSKSAGALAPPQRVHGPREV